MLADDIKKEALYLAAEEKAQYDEQLLVEKRK